MEASKEFSEEFRNSEDEKIWQKAFDMAYGDKFYGLQATGNDSEEVFCNKCKEEMVFLAQFRKGDMKGYEDWFWSVFKICPNGHEVSYQGVRS